MYFKCMNDMSLIDSMEFKNIGIARLGYKYVDNQDIKFYKVRDKTYNVFRELKPIVTSEIETAI